MEMVKTCGTTFKRSSYWWSVFMQGNHLEKAFINRGAHVCVLDNLSGGNLQNIFERPFVTTVEAAGFSILHLSFYFVTRKNITV
jgi:hypothetical protein